MLSPNAARAWQLLSLSARSEAALETATANLAAHLKRTSDDTLNLADVAYTLQVGRRTFGHQLMAVCQGVDDTIEVLEISDPKRVFSAVSPPRDGKPAEVVFLFPGQGAQYVNMAADLYRIEPTFREWVDHGAACLRPHVGQDLRRVLYPDDPQFAGDAPLSLEQTAMAQPALFVIEYALAQLWMSWGVHPQAMIGHSIGEYTAACLAGVFSLEDALELVAARGRLMQQLPGGAMLAVPLSELETRRLMTDALSVAADNAPSRCVVSGPTEAVVALERELDAKGLPYRRLHTSHAFHSGMMDPILDAFRAQVGAVTLQPPQMPYVSNVTGTWMSAADAVDADYWARHLRHTVRFAAGMDEVLHDPERILLEVGPGRALTALAQSHPKRGTGRVMLTSLPPAGQEQPESEFLLQTVGRLWLAGVNMDWSGFYAHELRQRLPLPTYPFERQRYWSDVPQLASNTAMDMVAPATSWNKKPDVADWFYMPSWKRSIASALQPDDTSVPSAASDRDAACCLLFVNSHGLGPALAHRLEQEGQVVVTVTAGAEFSQLNPSAYTLNPKLPADYEALFETLRERNQLPGTIVHLWHFTPDEHGGSNPAPIPLSLNRLEQAQTLGFHSLLCITQALGRERLTGDCQIVVVSNGMYEVSGDETICPEKSTVLGPVRVIPQEYPHIRCRNIDLAIPGTADSDDRFIEQLLDEIHTTSAEPVVAYRGTHRWVQTFEAVRLDGTLEGRPRMFSFDPLLADGTLAGAPRLRAEGVYLITGGLGGMGLVLAEHLVRAAGAKLILTGRSELPARAEWDTWLAAHDAHDRVSRKIQNVRELEALGANVLVLCADVASTEQMQAAIHSAMERFGRIDGVIHAAGVPSGGVIQRKTPAEAEQVMASKVTGTLILDEVLADVPLDFFVLCSSLASVQGIFGQVDYVAANAFLDAFAHDRAARAAGATICINWDTWQEVGMAVDTEVPSELEAWRDENLRHGISSNEGMNAFNCILGSRLQQVLVSTQDLPARLAQISTSVLAVSEHANWAKPMHPRPELSSALCHASE